MSSDLNETVRAIVYDESPLEALERARDVDSSPPDDWTTLHWLQVADGASSAGVRDPWWFLLAVFAHERFRQGDHVLQGLFYRVRVFKSLGATADDPLRSLDEFVARARSVVDGDDPASALVSFKEAFHQLRNRESPGWNDARLAHLRGRALRRLGRALREVDGLGLELPEDLVAWLVWADVEETPQGVQLRSE